VERPRRRMATKIKTVPAPKGYHWMKKGSGYQLMKNPKDGYKRHKGSSLRARFSVQETHKK
jgi:hypothetical protein